MEWPEPIAPRLELIARLRATLAPPLDLGQTPWGRRRVIGITGGEFDGPLLSGKVLPGGADWQVIHEDGTATIDTRYTLECQDGALISVATRGWRHGPREVLERLAQGETVDPSEYYFRVSIQYETSAPEYEWLNCVVAVASAVRLPDQVVYDAYVVR
jgi:5-methylphenazine-1-carboxylate 1-monooxygenase